MMRRLAILVLLGSTALAEAPKGGRTVREVALPGATGSVSLDYIGIDRAAGKLWVPAGNTGSVDVYDTASGKISRVEGFPTAERTMKGRVRKLGPSSIALGEGVAWAGNRANSEVCAIDTTKLQRTNCTTLPTSPDGLEYVAAKKELWITTPRDKSLTILDSELKPAGKITTPGEPEGYAVDDAHGVFYTNLEDADRTLKIDVGSRKILATWKPECGEKGPRGVAVDPERNYVYVACTDHVVVLDGSHDGAILAKADTGAGVDNIDYLPSKKELFVGAGKAARLTIFSVGDHGALQTVATTATADGARTVVADAQGNAYLINPEGKGIIVVEAPR